MYRPGERTRPGPPAHPTTDAPTPGCTFAATEIPIEFVGDLHETAPRRRRSACRAHPDFRPCGGETATDVGRPTPILPIASESQGKLVVYPPLSEALARGS
nr:DUF6130 family protein [Variovorax sp. S12S4]